MSSTNRGGLRSEADNYSTPLWAVQRFLEVYQPPAGLWLEPAAGDGNIITAANAVIPNLKWMAWELREECRAPLERLLDPRRIRIADFITHPPQLPEGKKFAVVISNPPYRLAQLFIDYGFMLADEVVMLLRLNYLGSNHRAPFLRRYPPDVYVLPNRPSFKGNGKTDSPEYAWFVFRPFQQKSFGHLSILPGTSAEERGLPGRAPRTKTPTVPVESA